LSSESLCKPVEKNVKASDYLRVWHLFNQGGIYLDADVEVLKPFDEELLSNRLFVGEEENGFVSNAVIGAEAGHPILSYYTGMLDRNFRGTGDMVFMPGIQLWTEIVKWGGNCHGIDESSRRVYPPEYFMPWSNRTKELRVTENSYTIHHFTNSWCGK
jgi:mannosyltransferase OCH1-like enzyme